LIKHRRSIEFKQLFAALPKNIQQEATAHFKLLQEDPSNPILHFKEFRSSGGGIHNDGTFSVRVTANYRALGTEVNRNPQTIVWFFIGDHAAYMKMASAKKSYTAKSNNPQKQNSRTFK